MQEFDEQFIIDAVNKALDKRAKIDEDTHRSHHDFIEELLQAQIRKQAFWKKVQETTVGWITIAILSAVGTLGYWMFKHAAKAFHDLGS